MNPTHREPRLFHLIRPTSTASVTDPLAEGVEWSDGTVTLRWRGQWPATSDWEGGIDAVLAVHGHHGSAELRWLVTLSSPAGDNATPRQAAATPEPTLALSRAPTRPVGGLRLPVAGMDGRCVRCGRVWPCLSCGP
jgi:hypothetical protein